MGKNIQFKIVREKDFAASLLVYNIYINGSFAGRLWNGQELTVTVPEASQYLIEEESLGRCAYLPVQNTDILSLQIHTTGGWAKPCCPVFYLEDNGACQELLQMSTVGQMILEKKESIRNMEVSSEEKTLLLCGWFQLKCNDENNAFCEEENLSDVLKALNTIGASKAALWCEDRMSDRLETKELLSDFEEMDSELRKCMAMYILKYKLYERWTGK